MASASRTVIVGLMVGFGGAVVMAVPGIDAGGNSARGVLLIAAALVSYGVAINLARPLQQRNGALPVVWRALAIALILTRHSGLRPCWPSGRRDRSSLSWRLGVSERRPPT